MGLANNLSDPHVLKSDGDKQPCHPSAPYESSSGDDNDSVWTDSSSIGEHGPVSPISPGGTLAKGFGDFDISDSTNTHIGNSMNAQDTHVGPRISAGNVNIIMTGSDLPDWTNDVVNTLKTKSQNGFNQNGKLPYTASVDSKQMKRKPTGFLRRRRKVVTIFIVISAILIASVIAAIIWWAVQDHKSPGPVGPDITTTAPPNGTTTTTSATPTNATTPHTPHTFTPGTITIPPSPPSPAPEGTVVSRSEWGGKDPPRRSARSYSMSKFENVIVDNLRGSHCSTFASCSVLLQKIEAGLSESLDYNFLIDDAGRIYEARGWHYSANTDKDTSFAYLPDLSLQIALIGDNSDVSLTEAQEATIQFFISNNSTFIQDNIIDDPTVRGQCALDIASETGPDMFAMCYIMKISGITNPCTHNCSACKDGIVNCQLTRTFNKKTYYSTLRE